MMHDVHVIVHGTTFKLFCVLHQSGSCMQSSCLHMGQSVEACTFSRKVHLLEIPKFAAEVAGLDLSAHNSYE